jgi:hypothetical protein
MAPIVAPRGLVCFHDVEQPSGVTRFYEELLRAGVGYRKVGGGLSLGVVEKA